MKSIIKELALNNCAAKVYEVGNADSYAVEFWKDGEFQQKQSYRTEDKDDAIDIAKYVLKTMISAQAAYASKLKSISAQELSEKQEAYRKFFTVMMAEYGVKSPAELPQDQRSAFFEAVKTGWAKQKSTSASAAGKVIVRHNLNGVGAAKDLEALFNNSKGSGFGRLMMDIKRVQAFCNTAKSDYLSQKRTTLNADLKQFIADNDVKQYYLKGNANDDSIKIFYTT